MSFTEFEIIQRYFEGLTGIDSPPVVLGIGDDAAVLRPELAEDLVISTDTQVEGRHFPVGAPPSAVAGRALAAAVSDLAAMAATPVGFTLALTLPAAEAWWLKEFAEGLARAATRFSIPLIGGDTCKGPLQLGVTVIGKVPSGQAVTRGGGCIGDHVWLTGFPGEARAALDLLKTEPDFTGRLADAYYRPDLPLAFASNAGQLMSAAIDVSDGLMVDLGHLLKASGCSVRLDVEAIPLSPALLAHCNRATALDYALGGGDDYQLCFSAPPVNSKALLAIARRHGVALANIGELCEGRGDILDRQGKPMTVAGGYQHF